MIIRCARKNKSVNGGHCQNKLFTAYCWILKKKGYLTITANADNKRERLIAFTESGKLYASSILEQLHEMEEHAMEKLGAEQRAQLIDCNTKYYELLKEELKNESYIS